MEPGRISLYGSSEHQDVRLAASELGFAGYNLNLGSVMRSTGMYI